MRENSLLLEHELKLRGLRNELAIALLKGDRDQGNHQPSRMVVQTRAARRVMARWRWDDPGPTLMGAASFVLIGGLIFSPIAPPKRSGVEATQGEAARIERPGVIEPSLEPREVRLASALDRQPLSSDDQLPPEMRPSSNVAVEADDGTDAYGPPQPRTAEIEHSLDSLPTAPPERRTGAPKTRSGNLRIPVRTDRLPKPRLAGAKPASNKASQQLANYAPVGADPGR